MTKPRVKPLVWQARDDLKGLHEARGADGLYRNVWDQQNGTWAYEGDPTANPQQQAMLPTIEAAKAAAQADYEARILSALDLTPDPAVQALVDAAREVLSEVTAGSEWESLALSRLDQALAAFDKT